MKMTFSIQKLMKSSGLLWNWLTNQTRSWTTNWKRHCIKRKRQCESNPPHAVFSLVFADDFELSYIYYAGRCSTNSNQQHLFILLCCWYLFLHWTGRRLLTIVGVKRTNMKEDITIRVEKRGALAWIIQKRTNFRFISAFQLFYC